MVLSSGFTNGTEDQVIWLSGAFCRGNESRLIDCRPFLSLGIAGICNDHTRDAGVNCGTIPPSYPCDVEGAIRLQGGNNTFGRVEICNDNVWGTVCDDSWGQVDAQIACRQLGFPAIGMYIIMTMIIIPYSTIFSWVNIFVDFLVLKENKGIYMVHTSILAKPRKF